MTADTSNAALSRISFTSKPEEAAKADLLSESVSEDPELKAKVFAQFNGICPARTIFTTDTSTLLPSMYASATGRPAQFAAFHFHQYVWDSNLVDIMPHPGTSSETVKLLHAFAQRIGQIPLVLKKESAGYVMNAILGAMNTAAFKLVDNGIASIEDVDRAVMTVMKAPMGPFGSLDVVGLDTVSHVMQSKARIERDPEAQATADRFRKEYIDKGWFGMKAGRGFYTYPDPAYARPGFLTGAPMPAKADRGAAPMESGAGDSDKRGPAAQPPHQQGSENRPPPRDVPQLLALAASLILAAAAVATLLFGAVNNNRNAEAQMQLLALGSLQHYLDLAVEHPDLASRGNDQPVDARYAWFAAEALTTAQTLWILVGQQADWQRSINAIVRQNRPYLRSGALVCDDFAPGFVSYLRVRDAALRCAESGGAQ